MGVDEVKFNLSHNIKNLDQDITSYMRIESLTPKMVEMIGNFVSKDPLEEWILNSLFIEDINQMQLRSTDELVEIILTLKDEANSDQDSE